MGEGKMGFRCLPRILGLFQKMIDGDDALLQMARERFRRAGLGTEFYAESPEELRRLFGFRPKADTLSTVHLTRGMSLLKEQNRRFVLRFAQEFGTGLFGIIIHDQYEVRDRLEAYRTAIERVDSELRRIGPGPILFVEYAVGLDPACFVRLFESIRDLERVSACIDTGHLGLYHVREEYARNHPGEDICALTPFDPDLPLLVEEIRSAVASALEPALEVIRGIGRVGKPLHFHLHDGHPLSTFSEFGVSDHLSFFTRIPIPFEFEGRRFLQPMYGPEGLTRMVKEALSYLGEQEVTFSLEIHPTNGRSSLGEEAHLFRHWREKENAERMSYWMSVLEENQRLVLDACLEARRRTAGGR